MAAAAMQTREIMYLLPCAGKPMTAAIQALEVMQLLPCAAKPLVAAIQAREFMLWSCCHARQNLWQLQFKAAVQVWQIMQLLS